MGVEFGVVFGFSNEGIRPKGDGDRSQAFESENHDGFADGGDRFGSAECSGRGRFKDASGESGVFEDEFFDLCR